MRKLGRIIFSINFLYILLIAAEIAAIIFLCLFVPAALPLAAAAAGAWLFSFITAAIILVRGDRESACAWYFVVCALPVLGAAIYLSASSGKKKWGILKVSGASSSPLSRFASSTCGTAACGYDGARYFKSGAECFECMFSAISRAKERVYAEFFIMSRGIIFDKFVAAIKSAFENGAEIKVLTDGVGSAFKLNKKDKKRLERAGAEVRMFGKITPLPRARLNFRDHRKIVAIDGRTAFIGGINLADEYAGLSRPFGRWKDSAVEICGPAAEVFEGMFLAMWNGRHEMALPKGGREILLPFCDSPNAERFAENAFLHAIYAANKRVHILTPYFCAGDNLLFSLKAAAMRGVDVKIILPHIPDKKYAFALSKATAATLMPYGVEFYEYTPGFMHAKAVICDDRAFLGSYNFDFRSTRLNFECGAAFGGKICDEAEEDFLQCLASSEPLKDIRLSPAKRMSRFVLRLFAPLI